MVDWSKFGLPKSFTPSAGAQQPTTQAPNTAALKQAIKDTASMLGISEDVVTYYLNSMGPNAPMGMSDLGQIAIDNALQGAGYGGFGGEGGGSAGIDWTGESLNLQKDTAIANLVAGAVADEVARKGMSVDKATQILGAYQQSAAGAFPSNMSVVPGFETGGMAEKLAKMTGTNISDTMTSAQNPQRANLPWSTVAGEYNEFKNTDTAALLEKYRPIIESMFGNIGGGVSMGGGGGGAGGGLSSGVGSLAASALGNAASVQDYPRPQIGSADLINRHGPAVTYQQSTQLKSGKITEEERRKAIEAWDAQMQQGRDVSGGGPYVGSRPDVNWIDQWVYDYRRRTAGTNKAYERKASRGQV